MDQLHAATHRRAYSIRTIVFWFFTVILAQELLAGSIWALLRNPFDREQLRHLGYPLYMLFILGAWKLGGGVVILLPRFQRLKEWAYAGAIFDFSGATTSHLFLGDGPQTWVYPALLVAVTLVSWALRPEERRLPSASSEGTADHHRVGSSNRHCRCDVAVGATNFAQRYQPKRNASVVGRAESHEC